MSILDTNTAASALKIYYSKQRMTALMYKDAPLYAMLDKVTDFFGSSYPLPMRITNPQGRSNTFANAQAQKVASNYKTFQLTRTHDYSLASIATEAMLASENDAGAFIKLATAEIDGAIESLKRSYGWAIYGDGSGAIGQVTATPANAAGTFFVTLTQVEDISKFEVGQTLVIWSAKTGGTQRTSDGTATTWLVGSVDRDAGVLGLTGTASGGGSIAANDYLFVNGDRGNKLSGLAGWIPSVAPVTGDNWFGVDRSIDATRLAGIRIPSAGKPLDEALTDAARRMGREGQNPDVLVTDFQRFAGLEKTLGAKVRYETMEIGGVGFRYLEVAGPKGSIKVFADRDCPQDKQYMLTTDSWGLYSLKEPAMLLDQDGNKLLRDSTSDSLEVRVGGYSQIGCTSPVANAVLQY